MTNTRFAEVMFRLYRFINDRFPLLHELQLIWMGEERNAYPNAPVPVVIIRTGIVEVLEKLSRIFKRLPRVHSPSILANGIESLRRYLSIRFKVLVQQEKTMLQREQTVSMVIVEDIKRRAPFRFPQIFSNVGDERTHFRGMSL